MDSLGDVTTQVVLVCADCGTHWYEGADEPGCADPEHRDRHQRFELHRHRTAVALPDGTEVTAVSFDAADPYGRDRAPDYGLYLDGRWAPPWAHDHVAWPDFGVPDDPGVVVGALRSLLDRARRGERVEVGCLGGHGRTGTALACLAALAGHDAADAVAWTRTAYCSEAVETPDQEAFVANLPL